MVYHVIGLMSGSSLDGLDICYVQLEEIRGKWSAQILAAECMPYTGEWTENLRHATSADVPAFLRLHAAYGHYTGTCVQEFIVRHQLEHKVHFIASHGHTVWHEPSVGVTFQLGDGAAIAAVTGLPVISDLRAMDVALGGQGAPIVPIGDRLLFGEFDLLLNIGGIANVTVRQEGAADKAFDICVANQALNHLAQLAGQAYDKGGALAASGKVLQDELLALNSHEYYAQPSPKSLSNESAMAMVTAFVQNEAYSVNDRLRTVVQSIADLTRQAITSAVGMENLQGRKMLITGGGTFNEFLISVLTEQFHGSGLQLVVPEPDIIAFKEAMVMALIGTLRWREETNVHHEVTGARRSSIGGAYWMGA